MCREDVILLLSSVIGDLITIRNELQIEDDFSDVMEDLDAAYSHLEAAFDALDI